MKIKKALYVVLGCIGVVLGAVGAAYADIAGVSIFDACGFLFCQKLRSIGSMVQRNQIV